MKAGQAIKHEVIQDAINVGMHAIGQGGSFQRVVAEIHRVNAAMPNATGADKKQKVLMDLKIIFDDLAIPLAGQFLNYLIEAALVYAFGRITEAADKYPSPDTSSSPPPVFTRREDRNPGFHFFDGVQS